VLSSLYLRGDTAIFYAHIAGLKQKKKEGTGMPVSCLEEEGVLTARITGEVDHHAAKELMTELNRRVDAALPRELRLDMEGVTFMDSSGIAVVLRSWKGMKAIGGTMKLCSVPPHAAKVLGAAGVDKLIPFTE
jgi:stage II sporulation protein AA (anti-sigma F factor antagonist)